MGGGDVDRDGADVRRHVLDRARADRVGVHLGDLSAEAEGPRGELGDGHQQGYERGDHHDVYIALQGDYHSWELLPLRRDCGGRVAFLLFLLAGDEGEESGGDGGALR